ncbi:beta-propeller domain-containing protein [Virgisporangium ochraceum]|uniref:beta-propeller domain-containing protein n=1 Tax=Virgisporangium ochraceum TaxID=65505 RepID=UPI001941D530|nr:beta-propeller domain-containing protein [Virgisporangium ochraceum]
MTRHAVAAIAAAVGLVVAGCTTDEPSRPGGPGEPPAAAGEFRLVSYADCDAALEGLRAAARKNVLAWADRSYGSAMEPAAGGRADAAEAGPNAARDTAKTAPGDSGGGSSGYSGTNTHEAGVDEPDIVKTDGKRIITVQGGVLRVVDATTRAQTARVPVATDPNDAYDLGEMLISGDKVLLIGARYGYYRERGAPIAPQLTLVDLAGTPRVLGRFGMSGSVVDARQVGSTVRVVVRSAPEIDRPTQAGTPESYRLAMIDAINKADVSDWLPRYTVDDGGKVSTGRVDCSAVAHPAEFTAATMLTVLSFDLTKSALGNGDPVTVAADGDTVYSNGPSLYVANDQRWRVMARGDGDDPARVQQRTEIYKFDTSKPGRPAFVAGGAVDGWLLNQYSMSDWNGHLRVATTTGTAVWGRAEGGTSESAVHTLKQNGRSLAAVGKVGGLGKGERIYSVRFVGPMGYVVTFRQTDPLYTVDLRDPAKPTVTGELKITGYSAYLHPAGDGLLLGIGQEANDQGRVQGTQISLFDVRDPAKPTRLAQHHVQGAHSEAEFDPHAFLYWPATGLLVVPLTGKGRGGDGKLGALALRVSGTTITELGFLAQPNADNGYPAMIRRSVFIDGTLWTVSAQGLQANDATTMAQQAWVPFA